MDDEHNTYHDRYDTSGNPEAEYVDDAKTVLRNKLGIADLTQLQVLEEEALTTAYEALLHEVRLDTPMTCELITHIHQRIFGALYEWAGRWRTVWIRKPGVTWPPPDFLDQNMQAFERDVLAAHTPDNLTTDDRFCRAVGEIQSEFLVIHPFREGNARTIKLLSDLLAAQTGRPLLVYDKTDAGRDRYIDAAKAAFKRNYAPMTEIIRQALAAAQQ
jgi:cell filamentation protein